MGDSYKAKITLTASDHEPPTVVEFLLLADNQEDANKKATKIFASKLSMVVQPYEHDPSKPRAPWEDVAGDGDLEVEFDDELAHTPNLEGTVGPKKFWVSWLHDHAEYGDFDLAVPWWNRGHPGLGTLVICAAIKATSEDEAKKIVIDAYRGETDNVVFRFCDEKHDDWHPFDGRFKRASWMIWNDHAQPKDEENL